MNMKRPLIVLAVGFVLGEVLALQNVEAVIPVCLGWLFAILGVLGSWWFGIRKWGSGNGRQGRGVYKRTLLLFLSLVVLGGGAGFGRGSLEKRQLDREEARAEGFAGVKSAVRGRIETVNQGDGSYSLVLKDVRVQAGNRQAEFGRVIVYVKKEDGRGAGALAEELLAGMAVELRGKLEAVERPSNPGVFDFRTYYRSKGITCRVFGESMKTSEKDVLPYHAFLTRFRSKCGQILETICTPEDSSVLKAVLLGDGSAMKPEVRTMYQRHGISHLLAVSGQHLAIIGGGIYLLMRRLGLGFEKAGLLSGVMVVSYGVMVQSPGSAMRAIIMILCLWLAAREGRSYDTVSALGLASMVLLWKSPYLLYQSGFQLSFGAVLAIGGLGSWLQHGFELKTPWHKTILISLCVQIVITPVVLFHYFQHPLYGLFLNLLVIPLMAVLMYSGLLGIMLGSFWREGGIVAAGAGHYVLYLYSWLCRQIERLPGYCLVMGRPGWFWLGAYGIGMAGGFYLLIRWKRRGNRKAGRAEQEKGRWSRSPWFLLAMSASLYGLCFLLLFPRPLKGLEVIVMDVGQGDGILLHTGGYTVLVDGGSSSDKSLGERALEPCLKSMGITAIDVALVSHGDSDHISGLLYLMEQSQDIRVRKLVLPAQGRGQEVYNRLEQTALSPGGRVYYMDRGDQIQVGELSLTCLYGGDGSFQTKDRNAHSLVVCADYEGFHMLFTGDMGMEQEKELMKLALTEGSLQQEHLAHVQVLKTAHHGSDTSSGDEFLDCLRPELAIISYGKDNFYGHPSPEVVERMKNRHITVMETGIGGAVMLWTDGSRLVCRYFK